MSDYISLAELRAMSEAKLGERWDDGQFPFDTAVCGNCVTQHKYFARMCRHEDFQRGADDLTLSVGRVKKQLRQNLERIYALRMFFRELYPSTPEPPVAEQQGRGVLVAK